MNQDKTFFEYKDEKGLDLDHDLCGGNGNPDFLLYDQSTVGCRFYFFKIFLRVFWGQKWGPNRVSPDLAEFHLTWMSLSDLTRLDHGLVRESDVSNSALEI